MHLLSDFIPYKKIVIRIINDSQLDFPMILLIYSSMPRFSFVRRSHSFTFVTQLTNGENLSHEWRQSAGLFINNCWIFASDRARTFDGETDRVIGVTVRSRRRFKRDETRREIKCCLSLCIAGGRCERYQRYSETRKKKRNFVKIYENLLPYNKFFFFFFSAMSVEPSGASNDENKNLTINRVFPVWRCREKIMTFRTLLRRAFFRVEHSRERIYE